MSVSFAIKRRRMLMETILLSLGALFEADPEMKLSGEHLFAGMQASALPPSDEEARAALGELIKRKMVEAEDDKQPHHLVPGKCYGITMKGLDFKRHFFPWAQVDEFAGKGDG